MEIHFWLRGTIIGLSIAAPVGPIGILCITRTLTEGRISGLASGLGAATADAIYGCIAGFGLTFISGIIINQQVWLRLVGGIFLFYLGLKTFLAKPSGSFTTINGHTLIHAYVSTFFLTLTNPMTILSFAVVFAGLGLANTSGSYTAAGALVSGIFIGSALWWVLLSNSVGLFRSKLNISRLHWINKISGFIIIVFGFIALLSL